MAKRNYVSNSSESTRMFKSDFLESLSKIHYAVPLIFWIPVIIYFIYNGLVVGEMESLQVFLYFIYGLAFWTLAEYVLHRWVFSFSPN